MSAFGFPPVLVGIPFDRIKQEVLSRLRWSILGSVEDIRIETGLNQDGTEELRPFPSHPLAMKSLTVPPTNRILISSMNIDAAMHFYLAPEDYQYDPQIIKNADGSPITIKDFVTQAHNHLSQNKEILFNSHKMVGFNSRPPPSGAFVDPSSPVLYYTAGKHDLFFKHASSSASSDHFIVNVSTFLEGEMGKSAEAFWKSQRATATEIASRRANIPGLSTAQISLDVSPRVL